MILVIVRKFYVSCTLYGASFHKKFNSPALLKYHIRQKIWENYGKYVYNSFLHPPRKVMHAIVGILDKVLGIVRE